MALNPPLGTNNLLALALREASFGRGDVGYVDTGEPVATTVTTTATTVQVNFPVNGVGVQPAVSCGAIALLISAVGTQTTVGPIVIEAVDTTATSGGHAEVVMQMGGVMPLGLGGCYVGGWAASLAAGVDSANGPLTNVVGLRMIVNMAGTTPTLKAQLVGVGTA